MMLLVNK